MFSFKDIAEAPDGLKALSVNALQIPFWSTALYLFNNDFYQANSFVTILFACTVLSLVSVFFFSLFLNAYPKVLEIPEERKLFAHYAFSAIIISLWLSLLIFVFYTIRYFWEVSFHFYWFVISVIIPIIGLWIFSLSNRSND